jgi:GH35 family endo-1,4-beta-xylanase
MKRNKKAKSFVHLTLSVVTLYLSFSATAVKGDWKSDANARIGQIRKTSAEITVLDSTGNPIQDVNVKITQKKHRFAFGTCIRNSQMSNNTYKNFILSHFEWSVCENETKWGSNESTRDVVTYTEADNIANWCVANGIKMRGHCLFWEQNNSQMPSWVPGLGCNTYPTASDMNSEIDERIVSAVNHFKGIFHNWDVDNEMLTDNTFGCYGETGRVHMFNYAKSLDPNCGMFMNEYSGNSFGGYSSSSYVNRANTLIGLGATINGFGIQAHLQENTTFQPQSYYDNVLQPLAALGRPIWATEFDAQHSNATTSADNIENFFRICFSHPSVAGIIMWGFMQNQMWRPDAYLIDGSGNLSVRGQRYEALMNEWTTNDVNITDLDGIVGFRGFQGTYEITLSKIGETNEIHTIVLDPCSTIVQFVLDTNFTGGQSDTNAPTPDPMTWSTTPIATGPYTITMTATTASDPHGVQYYFDCITTGGHDSNWQDNRTYTDTGLNPSTQYTYQVKARDKSVNHNETGLSIAQSATTYAPDTIPPTPNPMTWATVPTATGPYSITMTANTADDVTSPPVQYYFECTNNGSKSSGWQSNATYVAWGLTPNTNYSFRVRARDSAPAPNMTEWSSTLSATTQMPPTEVNIIGSWLTGTTHAKENGSNRALIFIAQEESASGNPYLSSVTYGGQAMTKIIEVNAVVSSGNYVAAFILNEANIAAASDSNFTPTWSGTTTSTSYASVFLQTVDQTTSVGASAKNSSTSSTPNPITTSALATNNGDMVILGATCGNVGFYTLNNNFVEGNDQQAGGTAGMTGVTGHKFATGTDETPSATYSATVNRQVIIGFVVKLAPLTGYQDCPQVQEANLRLPSDLNGNCYVDYLDLEIVALYWLHTDCAGFGDCEHSDFEPDGDVDFGDLSTFGLQWMSCNDPEDPDCTHNW